MDKQEVIALIRSEMARADSANRFRLNPTNRHIHNGTDAPFAFQPAMNYGGIVQLDGLGLALPTGWSVVYNGTGSYTIVHNLNTTFYVAMVSPILSITLPIASVTPGDDRFDVTWTNTQDDMASDTSFSFLLVDLTNRNDTPPKLAINSQIL